MDGTMLSSPADNPACSRGPGWRQANQLQATLTHTLTLTLPVPVALPLSLTPALTLTLTRTLNEPKLTRNVAAPLLHHGKFSEVRTTIPKCRPRFRSAGHDLSFWPVREKSARKLPPGHFVRTIAINTAGVPSTHGYVTTRSRSRDLLVPSTRYIFRAIPLQSV